MSARGILLAVAFVFAANGVLLLLLAFQTWRDRRARRRFVSQGRKRIGL